MFSTVTVDDPNLDVLVARQFPFVVINRVPSNHPAVDHIDSVIIDSYAGGYKAAEHLYRLGHDRIAIAAGSMKTSTARERTKGAEQALKDHGLKLPPRHFADCDYSFEKAAAATRGFLRLNPRPTAVMAHDDNMALGVREAAMEVGLTVPGDLAVVGFDDIRFANLKGIELTTISQKKYEMGTLATETLIKKIENDSLNMVNKVVLAAELVIRRSCGFYLTGYVR